MKKYKFEPRWQNWIMCLIFYDFKKSIKYCLKYLPSGSVGKLRIFEKINEEFRQIDIKPILVGDETKKQIDDFNKEYPGKINSYSPSRRKPITEFNKNLRWFKLKEEGYSYFRIYKKDIKDNSSDWNDLLDDPDKKHYAESLGIDRIKQGVKEIRDRINKPK
jgi:hypothetical protein